MRSSNIQYESIAALTMAAFFSIAGAQPDQWQLNNGHIHAEFLTGGLTRLSDSANHSVEFGADSFSIAINDEAFSGPDLKQLDIQSNNETVTYRYQAGKWILRVVYELKPTWHFVSKQVILESGENTSVIVNSVEVFVGKINNPIVQEHKTGRSGGVFLRLDSGPKSAKQGLFLAIQNPFLKWTRQDQRISMAYQADMEWRSEYGPFVSDRVCIGPYELTGREQPARGIAEWAFLPDPEKAFDGKPMLDSAETDALTGCVEAFVQFHPDRSLKVHVPWCENDYQIDVGTPEGRTEYKRIIDQAAAVGCEHMLFTPGNSSVSSLAENADAWGWENCLWLGLGQKIRMGKWDIAKDPIPASIQEMLDYAKSKNIKFVAYSYPTLGWKQDPEWTRWCGGKTGGYVGADTGVRSFQDWFVDQLVAFQKRTGISGYSFDHWWIAYEAKDGNKPTSQYAQWYGCRRILEELRRRIPDVVIDGRQQYQWFGPWTWLGGSYPHPTTNDEQPGSFENFPDLHFSRVSGDRQRWAAWWYRMEQFTPLDVVPGYMTHQTPRNDAQGQCVRDREFHTRDWDLLGWKYSVLSSIGTAPFNHVVDLLPARDETEFRSFRPEDQKWWRGWMEWTDKNRATLRQLRTIIGPPVLGRIDGTAAVVGDRGFVFLFNPNYRSLDAEFVLDESIGLTQGDRYALRELYPMEGRLMGKPQADLWRRGDRVQLPIKGPQAVVLEIVPESALGAPYVLNAQGKVELSNQTLRLTEIRGPIGTSLDLVVPVPANSKVQKVLVNGRELTSFKRNEERVSFPITFTGVTIDHCQQIGKTDRNFAEKTFHAEFTIPQQIFTQLAQRRKDWPIPYTQEELLATWRGSDRLLLYIHIADPDDKWTVGLSLDGKPVQVQKAYNDVFPLGRERTFTGFYADVSSCKPDRYYSVEVALPDLKPGQFQGLFFENVKVEYTNEIVP